KSLNALASGRKTTEASLRDIQEGSFICTNCYRCTTVCPVGINLQDLWLSMKDGLAAQGYPEPQAWVREKGAAELASFRAGQPELLVSDAKWGRQHMRLTDDPGTFAVCFECQACTNACPVVANYDDPVNHLDLLPHQITHALNLGQRDLVLGSRMIWDCLTCYLCQEHCPQGVRVTDVLYELKNIAYQKARAETGAGLLSKKEGPDSGSDGERL
ncbi:MAG: 4Fe-4S dicluster domain-containing protein, partial [Pseudomonadota bacterium]